MVHVRKIEGEPVLFGNQGALFKGAMTWWDHKTESVWSQVWGKCIEGPLKGTTLELLTSSTVPWGTWKQQHPNTLLMINDLNRFRLGRRARFQPHYVIGIQFDGLAKAYPYEIAARERVINDEMGGRPILVFVDPETHAVATFFRLVEDRVLTFGFSTGHLVDHETGSRWDPVRGLAIAGPLQGSVLRQVPYIPAYQPAWRDFYPQTEIYSGAPQPREEPASTATPCPADQETGGEEWAVQLVPGADPDQVAAEYGAVNRGSVGSLPNVFVFQPAKGSTNTLQADRLAQDPRVTWFERQEAQQRYPRSSTNPCLDHVRSD